MYKVTIQNETSGNNINQYNLFDVEEFKKLKLLYVAKEKQKNKMISNYIDIKEVENNFLVDLYYKILNKINIQALVERLNINNEVVFIIEDMKQPGYSLANIIHAWFTCELNEESYQISMYEILNKKYEAYGSDYLIRIFKILKHSYDNYYRV